MPENLASALVLRMYEIDVGQEGLADKYGLLWKAVLEETERSGFRFVVETPGARNGAVIRHVGDCR